MQVSELEALKKRAMLLSQCIESERILLDNKLLELSTEKANAEEKVEQLERLLEEKQISIRELQLENQSLRDVSNYKPEKCTACGDVISDAELQLNAVLDQLLAAEARMRELEVSLAVEAGAAKVRGACIMLWARRGRHNVRQVVEARAAEETAARSKADAECDRLRELLVQVGRVETQPLKSRMLRQVAVLMGYGRRALHSIPWRRPWRHSVGRRRGLQNKMRAR
mmetsp:Transcript_81018/g.217412  ORF Transcript_81018/g.217412 Transcript_81018/m.217412 type:complete len:226 (+) Transcript_81018:790-1467(+)